jgi:competence CoiA-like predicted nuclease
MFEFCPHCGQTIEQEEVRGQMLVCIHCKKEIGLVIESERAPAPPPLPAGMAARCPACNQLVALKAGKTFVPHYAAGQKKICPGSGKAS